MQSTDTSAAVTLDIAIAEFLEAEESGQPQVPQDWLARYPDLADELQAFFISRQNVPRLWPMRPLAETPSQLGDYELLEPIARGGMGIVYKARHSRLNRIVALKLIVSGQLARRCDIERFHAEAQAAAGLEHPSIVPIYEVGQHAGQHYFTMKFIEAGVWPTHKPEAQAWGPGQQRSCSRPFPAPSTTLTSAAFSIAILSLATFYSMPMAALMSPISAWPSAWVATIR
jgi:hypothetical protein